MKKPKIIALDCDGVLLNYNQAYGKIYSETFNQPLQVAKPNAYHAHNYWGIEWDKQLEKKSIFQSAFNEHGWKNMPALEGSIEATHLLRSKGYKIFVVTSMPEFAEKHRHENLTNLGFAVDATIATGSKKDKKNPKKPYIDALMPEFFVDDLIENFHNIDSPTKFVWIDWKCEDNDQSHHRLNNLRIHHEHENLLDFVKSVIL